MKFSFFSKMTLAILFPVLITLVIMSGTMYLKANDLLRTNVREQVALLAKSQGEALSAAIMAYKDMVLELSHNSDILNAVASDMQGDSRRFESYRDAAIGKLKRIEKMSPAYYGLGITDKQGKIILHSKDSRMGESFSQKVFIKDALNGTMKPEIVPLGEHSMGLALAQPIYIGKQIFGAAFLVINLNIMAEEITDYITFANSGAVGVHDGSGLQIMHKYRDYIGLQEGNTPYFREMKGQSSGIVFFEYKNEKWVWYFYQIPWLDWYVTCSVKQADLEAGAKDLFMISTVISIASILVLFTIIFIFAKRTAKSLRGIEKISREVSEGKLNLSREEDLLLDNIGKRTDEIGGMAVSFKQMIVALIDTIRDAKAAHKNGMVEAAKQLEKIVESCSTATQELSAQIQESSNGAEMQADRISATVTAVEEMNSTILEVTQNTVQTAKIANNTKQKAEESEAVVNDFMGSIRKVEASTDTLKADMNKLFGHVQDINQVMGVISDLADQTNLLALNAAIEAARAGEFGRGFAVVADEVRKLAEKTMASTARVSNAVIAIKTSTESSMHQVDDTVALVNTAIELATSCHSALEEIMHMASESAERIGSIAVASEEQSSTSEEITHSINEINHIVSQTSNTMREANIAIMELAKQSEIITGMINNMKSGN